MTCSCGAPVRPPRRRYCSDECYQAAETERKRERARERYWTEPAYRERELAKRRRQYQAAKDDPERRAHRAAYQRRYRRQHRKQAREYGRAWRERLHADPERHAAVKAADRERMRQRRASNPELYRQRAAEAYRKARQDPRAWEQRLAWQRMYYRLRAMRDGRPVRPPSVETYERRNGSGLRGPRLDSAPLAVHVKLWLAEDSERDQALLAELAGLPERRIYGTLHGERMTVQTADRLALGLGLHLGLVYDLETLR